MQDFRLVLSHLLVETQKNLPHSCRFTFLVYPQPGSFWSSRGALFQYVRSLTAAAEGGDSAEVSWLLSHEPADLADLQGEAFHCALFAAVISGHHKTAETVLQQYNPGRAALLLPACAHLDTQRRVDVGRTTHHWEEQGVQYGRQLDQPTSYLALAYGWERDARGYPMNKEEYQASRDRGGSLSGSQHLGLLQLLLEYGVRPSSAIEGLLQKLVCTLDMPAVTLLQAHQLDVGACQLSDGRTLLHLLVSSRFCQNHAPKYSGSREEVKRCNAQAKFETQLRQWQDEAAPLLQLLLATPGATLRRDSNNKTAMDICLPEYTQFMSAMNNARISAQPLHRSTSDSDQGRCAVCVDRRASVVIIPYGHLCLCQPCSSCLQQQCPVCRGAIVKVMQTYST